MSLSPFLLYLKNALRFSSLPYTLQTACSKLSNPPSGKMFPLIRKAEAPETINTILTEILYVGTEFVVIGVGLWEPHPQWVQL